MIKCRSNFLHRKDVEMLLLVPRHQQILELVKSEGFMPIEKLAIALGVTSQTIRRDIAKLCELHVLRRYHGGVCLESSVKNDDYVGRKNQLHEEKAIIAALLAADIRDHTSLFISIGTSVEAVARALVKQHQGLHVITNSIHVAAILSENTSFTVIITAGVVRPADGGITGVTTLDFVSQFKVDYAILGVAGIESAGNLLDFDYPEVRVARAMMNNARKKWLVADHSKFGRNALVKMGHIDEFDALFSNELPVEPYAKMLQNSSVLLCLP